MLVCQCNGVSERSIRRLVRGGAVTVRQVARGCGAGACCGDCAETIRDLIRAEAAEQREELRDSTIVVANATP